MSCFISNWKLKTVVLIVQRLKCRLYEVVVFQEFGNALNMHKKFIWDRSHSIFLRVPKEAEKTVVYESVCFVAGTWNTVYQVYETGLGSSKHPPLSLPLHINYQRQSYFIFSVLTSSHCSHPELKLMFWIIFFKRSWIMHVAVSSVDFSS